MSTRNRIQALVLVALLCFLSFYSGKSYGWWQGYEHGANKTICTVFGLIGGMPDKDPAAQARFNNACLNIAAEERPYDLFGQSSTPD